MTESFAELFEKSYGATRMRPGTIINATVIDIDAGIVLVNAGLKSESVIPVEQFYDQDGNVEVGIGDEIEVALDSMEDGFGETKLSREKAKRFRAWAELEKAHEDNETVTGVIIERVKGGFAVDLKSVRAFLPGSLVDVRPVRDMSYLEGQVLEFKLIKIDRPRNNIVISRRAVMETENLVERERLLDDIKEGGTIAGVVKNLTDYGAFLDLGGIDGLLHITDMAWKRVKSPADIVSIGETIDVKVLKFDRERNRVSLGLKQMTDDPWSNLVGRYSVGDRVRGQITNLADYGCFVELEEGVEGLVHISEMDWKHKNIHPSKLAHIGEEAEVMILDIDQERRRISLGMKQCKENPWKVFEAAHSKNDRITSRVKSITDFGIFVGLEGDIDGLIHLSDISWRDGEAEELLRQYKKGEEIETVILAIDAERERISLGIKQLETDPFSAYIAQHPKGSLVTGQIIKVDERLVTVQLAEQVIGLLKASELLLEKRVEDARMEVNEGEQIEIKIMAIDRQKRSINVSARAKDIDEEQMAVKEYAPNEENKAKWGDLLKEHLEK